ncbi:phage integrase family protein [Caballeronia sp. LZ008]|uniref:phage integrase family protein n=1 Tax=Caballeronia sp. LZ008 TaxID=3038560 RepID=UPI0028549B6F|nr:phage integrase family protein [Caballeronia sp. LZ008]MDR5798014.1 phage integrase family protein [Caballeronia sp. LZ008]
MANQPQQLTLPPPRTYTRTDFTALRAFVQRLPVATIARLYYDPERSPHAASADAMGRFLGTMRDDLVHLALLHGSSVLADHLKASIKQHGSAKLSAMTLRMVEQASTLAAAVPLLTHPVHLWFRPLIAQRLNGEGIATLGALIDYCNARGGSWWRAVPRIGALRARTIVAWLRRHETTLGMKVADDVDTASLVPAQTAVKGEAKSEVQDGGQGVDRVVVIGGNPSEPRLAPFEHLAVPAELSGGEGNHRGLNRASAFAFIRAEHDLAAVHAYLHRYRDRPTTLRAYTRELERLILWSVVVRHRALSSLTVEDCEAYKDFLKAPLTSFTGPKRPRTSNRWRPFVPEGLSVDSQAYAVRVLRAAFAWLVEVRYLAGNPWSAVHEPATVTRELSVQVHRALPAKLWAQVRAALDARCDSLIGAAPDAENEARQWRAARAAILLMGDSGLRRAEAALARREDLRIAETSDEQRSVHRNAAGSTPQPAPGSTLMSATESGRGKSAMWTLSIVGKRRKQRTVPVSGATIAALRAHWDDRDRDFDAPRAQGPLIAPQWIPATRAALERHDADADDAPYTVDALGRLVRTAVQRLSAHTAALADFSTDDLVQLANTSAHAFRHTFGTRAVAREMPTDVVQAILGHASLQTTSIYVRAERRRMLEAAARYYADEEAQQ